MPLIKACTYETGDYSMRLTPVSSSAIFAAIIFLAVITLVAAVKKLRNKPAREAALDKISHFEKDLFGPSRELYLTVTA